MVDASALHSHGDGMSSPTGRGWMIAWGVLLIIAGFLAVLTPEIAALATTLSLGWLLLLAGVFEIAYALQTRRYRGFSWKLASGIVTLILGVLLLAQPVAGAASIALMVGAFLFTGGLIRTILGVQLRPLPGWGWVLFDGLLSILLAGLIATGWPENSLAIIGVLTGCWLISAGIWRIALR
ncbi:MAG: HdeD family acid-resistance protein [Sphingobium sp.]|uniref:HdeD family acid-resistance protein n=1 Tax=Sphingobium sp. TaxID=1912891 RepID=UPI0029A46076|nr:HdeD family acid-resistance protein [Sphingobium sp.]MDX3910698.1 HdeD family acid-resistance protein [Sphingobium sp.]